jgi:wyosine [tRNA(Phe)-imidazoG37] synthetase (radical SAM superfamily)
VRERRRILSERYGHDLQKYYEHLREIQSQYASRLVNQITVIRSSGQTAK